MLRTYHILITLLLFPTVQSGGLMVTVTTVDQRTYRGSLAGREGGLLHLAAEQPSVIHTIPERAIASLSGEELKLVPMAELEPVLSLLPLWEASFKAQVMDRLELLAAMGNWQKLHYWTQRLRESNASADCPANILILQAWALLELHLPGKAKQALADYADKPDPLEVPWRYCWLMARIAISEDQPEAARRWASLPLLRIPSAASDVRERLRPLLTALSKEESR